MLLYRNDVKVHSGLVSLYMHFDINSYETSLSSLRLWKGFSDEIPCVQLCFCFLRLQFYFVNYVIVSCELPYYNSFDHRMLLKN